MELKACYHGDYEIPFTIANPKVTRNILAPSRNSLQNMLRLLCEAVNAAEEQHTQLIASSIVSSLARVSSVKVALHLVIAENSCVIKGFCDFSETTWQSSSPHTGSGKVCMCRVWTFLGFHSSFNDETVWTLGKAATADNLQVLVVAYTRLKTLQRQYLMLFLISFLMTDLLFLKKESLVWTWWRQHDSNKLGRGQAKD